MLRTRVLKFTRQITSIITKANQQKTVVLGCFLSRNPKTLFEAFEVYIRSLLEYASAIWLPSNVGQIICLEGVRRDFTKHFPECCQHGLETIELRRSKFDIHILFNIIKGNNCLNLEQFFTKNQNKNWRGHWFKIVVPLDKTNSLNFSFHIELLPYGIICLSMLLRHHANLNNFLSDWIISTLKNS